MRVRLRCALALLISVFLAWSALGPVPAAGRVAADDRFERLAAFAAEKLEELGIPGAAVGVLHAGTMTMRAFGVTSVDHPLPVTEDTLFQVGSISKTFTGTLLMRLAEAGKVDLQAPVRKYLPEFRVQDERASREAKVIHLLTHLGGWEGDVFEDAGSGDDVLQRYVARLASVEQVAPLAQVWSYNNAGFAVAGRIVEIVTGKTFEEALEELVLNPLELKNTYIRPEQVMTLRFVVGHGLNDERKATVQRPWPIGRYAHSMGGVISTVPDLLRYARFHLGDGTSGSTTVLATATLRQMHAAQLVKQATEEEMAITWHLRTVGGVRQLTHGGATLGQQALLTLVPDRGFAVALVTNASRGSRFNQDVSRRAIEEYVGIAESDPDPLPQQPDLAAYAGRYGRPFAHVVVAVENGRLTLQSIQRRGFPNAHAPVPPPGPKLPVAFYAPDRLIVTEGPRKGASAQFVRNADGSIGWVRVGGRVHRRLPAGSS